MERNKYIAAIVLGFLVILGLGIISIKLFRAKRSTAPEHEALLTATATPTPTLAPSVVVSLPDSDAALEVPAVTSSAALDTFAIPESVVKYLGQERAGVVVQSVTYADGKKGVKAERDLPIAITALNETLRTGMVGDRTLLAYKTGTQQSEFAFRTTNPNGRVVVSLTQKSATVTTFSAHLIFE